MVSGMLNLHPADAMALMKLPEDHPERRDFAGFYDRLAGDTEV
jgi:hypothetical protein